MRRAVQAVAWLATLMAAGCAKGPGDQAITTEVKAKYFSDAELKAANLEVSAKEGTVTLAGEVPSEGARYRAFKLAAETAGVRQVEDRMTVAVAAQAQKAAEVSKPAERIAPVKAAASPPAAKPRRAPEAREAATAAPPPAAVAEPSTPAVPAPIVPAAPETPKPIEAEIPAGTELVVRMIDSIDTEVHQAGEKFRASLDVPIVVEGQTVAPAGADVTVEIAEAKSAGRMAGRSELKLQLSRLEFQGRSYALVTDTYQKQGASEGKQTATKVGIGAAAGAVIGAIAGGGKGAAIGATVGAGGGTAVSAARKGEQVKVPTETRLSFTLQSPVTVTYLPDAGKTRRR